MPWDGYQKPPRSCPGSEDNVVASLCLPGDCCSAFHFSQQFLCCGFNTAHPGAH